MSGTSLLAITPSSLIFIVQGLCLGYVIGGAVFIVLSTGLLPIAAMHAYGHMSMSIMCFSIALYLLAKYHRWGDDEGIHLDRYN